MYAPAETKEMHINTLCQRPAPCLNRNVISKLSSWPLHLTISQTKRRSGGGGGGSSKSPQSTEENRILCPAGEWVYLPQSSRLFVPLYCTSQLLFPKGCFTKNHSNPFQCAPHPDCAFNLVITPSTDSAPLGIKCRFVIGCPSGKVFGGLVWLSPPRVIVRIMTRLNTVTSPYRRHVPGGRAMRAELICHHNKPLSPDTRHSPHFYTATSTWNRQE